MLFLQYNLIDEAWEENEFQLPSLIQGTGVTLVHVLMSAAKNKQKHTITL